MPIPCLPTRALLLTLAAAAHAQSPPHKPHPKPQYPYNPNVVLLDPAHGGSDNGAKLGDSLEKDATVAFAGRLKALLLTHGFTVLLTHEAPSDQLAPDQRAEACQPLPRRRLPPPARLERRPRRATSSPPPSHPRHSPNLPSCPDPSYPGPPPNPPPSRNPSCSPPTSPTRSPPSASRWSRARHPSLPSTPHLPGRRHRTRPPRRRHSHRRHRRQRTHPRLRPRLPAAHRRRPRHRARRLARQNPRRHRSRQRGRQPDARLQTRTKPANSAPPARKPTKPVPVETPDIVHPPEPAGSPPR